ncbi:MAG: helicase-related protein, partial [Coprothermobacterota bacterium]|nr:helicase-related protein [Coprothermobacterota bacterium]
EAAFLPILTLLQEDPPQSVGVLYIGPTKALINDQFLRLNDLLVEAQIQVTHWHGDVPQSEKTRLLRQPRGVLQITPESMEGLLMNRKPELTRAFGDLRFVVIDEVHVFMNSDRGRQILCQLQRLRPYLAQEPRRIGLSATLGNYDDAEQWLRAGTERPVITPHPEGGEQRFRLAVEHFFVPQIDRAAEVLEPKDLRHQPIPGEKRVMSPFIQYIYENTRGRKALIFSNSKEEAESMLSSLRMAAKAQGAPDVYFMHHGSISAPLREAAEEAMRDPLLPAVVAATMTLELGIDIGRLERVLQLEAPYSVSSFLQRLGRSGRRGNPPEMILACAEEEPLGKELLPQQLPWSLLQAIAIIQLYLEEHWVEPQRLVRYPFSLLYHQTMSILASQGELTPADLAKRVLGLPPFRHVTQDDLRELLRHLLKIDHLQHTEEGGLIIGLAGEAVVRSFRFFAVFQDDDEFSVKEGTEEIGSIAYPPPPGERFGLAGRPWEVLEVDIKRKFVFVRGVEGKALTAWPGPYGIMHTRIKQRMRQVLLEEKEYDYLQPHARKRIAEARSLARHAGLEQRWVLHLGGTIFAIFPWMGTRSYRTLNHALRHLVGTELGIKGVEGQPSNYFLIKMEKGQAAGLCQALAARALEGIQPESLVGANEAPVMQKYDVYVPASLLRKAYAYDHLDVEEFSQLVSQWKEQR